MSRAQQGETYTTAQGQNQTNEANAQKSESAEQADIGNEQSQLAKFAANNPYMQGGQYQTAQNQNIAGAADASASATRAAEQNIAGRSGSNPQAAVAAAEAAGQQAQRTASSDQGDATTSRIANQSAYNQQALSDQNSITQQQENLASLQSGAAQGALGTQEQAAQTPSFMDELGNGLIQAGVGAASAYCPARGSLILMADGTEKAIEKIVTADMVLGFDQKPQKVEAVRSVKVPVVLALIPGMGCVRVSRSHAFMLSGGGFVEACDSRGAMVVTKVGPRIVADVHADGMEDVFDVITEGSHTYRADGAWAIGNAMPEAMGSENTKFAETL